MIQLSGRYIKNRGHISGPSFHYICTGLGLIARDTSLGFYGNGLYLNKKSWKCQGAYFNPGTGWRWVWEELRSHLVGVAEQADIRHEDGNLDHIRHGRTG